MNRAVDSLLYGKDLHIGAHGGMPPYTFHAPNSNNKTQIDQVLTIEIRNRIPR